MGDEALRQRERETRGGDPASALAAAATLMRAGRRDEAFELLWPLRADPAIHVELLRFPAWTHRDGDPGHSRSIDAPVPRTEPRVRWSVSLPTERLYDPAVLLVGAAGLALTRSSSRRVLDPDTGEVILDPREVAQPDLLAEVRDSWMVQVARRVAGRKRKLWAWSTKRPRTVEVAAVTPDLVLVRENRHTPRSMVHAFEAESGVKRFEVAAGKLVADAHGVVHVDPKAGLVARDLGGKEQWSTGYVDRILPEAIDGAHVVSNLGDIYDRATGAVRARLDLRHASWLLARDVVLCWSIAPGTADQSPCLAAFTTAGARLWQLRWPDQRVHHLAAFGGRLYAHTCAENISPGFGTDRLVCLEA